jgi:hypothetical protein
MTSVGLDMEDVRDPATVVMLDVEAPICGAKVTSVPPARTPAEDRGHRRPRLRTHQ